MRYLDRSLRLHARSATTYELPLPSIAVNIYGHAISDPLPDHESPEIINCLPATNQQCYKYATTFRNDLSYTTEELSVHETPETSRFLVIGYALRQPNPALRKHSRDETVRERNCPVGIKRPRHNVPVSRDEPPILVVTEVDEAVRTSRIVVYGLVNQERGLCTPYALPLKDVFFRHEYRDCSTTPEGRQSSWCRAVSRMARLEGERLAKLREANDGTADVSVITQQEEQVSGQGECDEADHKDCRIEEYIEMVDLDVQKHTGRSPALTEKSLPTEDACTHSDSTELTGGISDTSQTASLECCVACSPT